MDFSKQTERDIPLLQQLFLVDPIHGLSEVEAAKRKKTYGPNSLPQSRVRPWEIFIRQFKSSFIYLLFFAGFLAFTLGEYSEGWMIALFLFINAFLGFYQEYRSEQTLELLKRYITPQSKVKRDGTIQTIATDDLVPGDIVVIEAGDNIPADIRLVEVINLLISEEPLTGESVPVHKETLPLSPAATEIYQAKNIVFSGTTVIAGRGTGIVFATGAQTVMGGIARITGATTRVSSFERELGLFSKFILYLVVSTLILIFCVNVFLKGFDSDIAGLAIFSIALAVSVIPEALPVVMMFSLSRGARRLAKNHVVVKRLSSIEDLGGIQVLCTDKTGTLTENMLTVHETYNAGPEKTSTETLFAGSLGGSYLSMMNRGQSADPFDVALWKSLSPEQQTSLTQYNRVSDIPFDPVRKKNSVLVEYNGTTTLIVRGSLEAILNSSQATPEEQKNVTSWAAEEGRSGRRVLAVASKPLVTSDYDETGDETNLMFIGCISFIDPIKESTRAAIKDASDLNVRIKILTGDSPEVAGAVAHAVGLAARPTDVMTAQELFMLHDHERMETLERINVFARVSPEEKYRIIELLQKNYCVGFLGEGINDAPALKTANVAIVVSSASDIAREVSDIILLEKSLDVIIGGIREGRAIFANTIKYIRSSLTSNFGNFYAVAISSLFITYLPMLPLQILLVNLLSDFPAIAIATDTVEPEEVAKPRQYEIKKILIFGTVLGIVSTVFDFITFAYFSREGAVMLQTHWFIASILTEILFLYSIRSRSWFFRAQRPSLPLFVLSSAAFIGTIVIPFTSYGHSLFGFVSPSLHSLGVVLGIVAAYFITTEIAKIFYYRLSTPTAVKA